MKTIAAAHRRLERAASSALLRRLGGPADRGDVPGWVLITIMTAGLVTALWAIAGPQLSSLFSDAISSVKGP
jgi:hypothetical protein